MNSDSSSGEWVYRVKAEESGQGTGTVWSPSLTPSTQCVKLTASLPSQLSRPWGGTEGYSHREVRARTVLLYFCVLYKSPLALIVRLALSNLSPCAVGMLHWPQCCSLIWRYGYTSQHQVKVMVSLQSIEHRDLQSSLGQWLALS